MNFIILESNCSSREQFLQQTMISLLRSNGFVYKQIDDEIIDCILVLNKKKLSLANKIARKHNAPIIYFFYNSEIEYNYNISPQYWDFVFILNDINIDCFFPYFNLSRNISFPFQHTLINEESEYIVKKDKNMFVYFDSFDNESVSLCKVLPVLNSLTNIKIRIKINRAINKFNINSNITLLKKCNLEEEVIQSDFVVGSGVTIFYGIKYAKPCIIIGSKGYGGILNNENIKFQYYNFFQGRIGGSLYEQTPNYLIEEDILSIYNGDIRSTKIKWDNEISDCRYIIDKMIELVQKNKIAKSEFQLGTYIFNRDFLIIRSPNNDELWIINVLTKYIVGGVPLCYYDLFETLSKGLSINSILDKKNDNERKLILSLLNDLVVNKILIQM